MWWKILVSSIIFFSTSQPVFATNVVINEFMAKPTGENEWVEILNTTSANIDLTNWVLQEKTLSTGVFNSYNLPNVLLFPNSLCFYEFSSSKLNDSGDTINLLNPVGIQQDTYTYTNAITGKTFSRVPDGGTWTENSNPTKTSNCSILTASSPSPSPTSTTSTVSTFTISNVPSSIDSTQTFNASVNLELSSYPSTKFYLKGAFAKSGSTNYFGYTKVNGAWVKNGSTYSDQYEITTDSSGKWSGNMEIQIDPLDNGYDGTGDYIFKVGRYTENGNGPTWTSESNIKINAKEVEDQGGVIDLSKLSSKETPKVLGETKKEDAKLPESVYSLENYRRSATISSTPSSSLIEIKSQKQNLFPPIAGGIFLGIGLGLGGYLIIKNRVK